MDVEKLALQFIDTNNDKINALIKDAFIKGFEEGLKNKPNSIHINGSDFIDLGLPSGKFWAKPISATFGYGKGYKTFAFSETANEDIPTIEDVEELKKHCRTIIDTDHVVYIVGPSGKRLKIYTKDYTSKYFEHNNKNYYQGEDVPEDGNLFWIKSDVENDKAKVLAIFEDGSMEIREHFTGFKLPLLFVRKID